MQVINYSYNLIKNRSLIAPSFVISRKTKPGAIKDRILIRLFLV